MSLPVRIPSVADVEVGLGVPVAGRPIEACLAAAANRAAYGETNAAVLAAAALWSVARSHPLNDGNKRASLSLADLVLVANDRHLEGVEEDLVQLAARAAARTGTEEWVAGEVARLAAAGVPAVSFADRYPEVIRRLRDDEYVLQE